mmetsp:Transcript_9284/g.26061  ORF Transcript_9284/g.26061 Transcript_9284/m.26061 type:complete len:296 (+) Transcript_9284:1332-2219(+)
MPERWRYLAEGSAGTPLDSSGKRSGAALEADGPGEVALVPAPPPALLIGDSKPEASSSGSNQLRPSASPLGVVRGTTPCQSSEVGGAATFSVPGSKRFSRPVPWARAPRRSARFSLSSCRRRSRLWSSSSRNEASLCRSSSSHCASSRIAACCSEATRPSLDLCQVQRFSLSEGLEARSFRASSDFWRLRQYRSCSSVKRLRTCCQCFIRPRLSSIMVVIVFCKGWVTAVSRSPASCRSALLNIPKFSRKLKQASAQSKAPFPSDLPGSSAGSFSFASLQTPCSSALKDRQFVTI